MANDQKKDDVKIVNVEFKVSMYCNACERTVARVISKIKGVETFTTDMNKQRVTVKGRIDAEKVLKKLRKKTGKRVEIVINNNNNNNRKDKKKDGGENETVLIFEGGDCKVIRNDPLLFSCWKQSDQALMMFSDENPNAVCSIM